MQSMRNKNMSLKKSPRSLFEYSEIQKIYDFQQDFFEDRNMKSYLEKCYSFIGECFSKKRSDTFLANKGYYFDRNTLEVIDYAKNPALQEYLIQAGEKMMMNGELISLSRSLFDTEITGALLYYGEKPRERYLKDINSFDLCLFEFGKQVIANRPKGSHIPDYKKYIEDCYESIIRTPKYKTELDKFFKKLKPSIEKQSIVYDGKEKPEKNCKRLEMVLLIYRLIYDNVYKSDDTPNFYTYFIRPVNLQVGYSGVLLLMLSSMLSADEYANTSFMLTSILSNTATEITKNEEWRLIADEQSHAFKHMFGALTNTISELKTNVRNHESAYALAEIAHSRLDTLNKVNLFMLNIMRAGQKGENEKDLSKVHRNNLQCRKVSLKDTLFRVYDTLSHSIELLGLSEDIHEANIRKKCLPKLAKNIESISDVYINVIPIGLEIVLTEILKNAIFNTDPKNPIVKIYLDRSQDFIDLHVTNNLQIAEATFKYIQSLQYTTGIAKQYKAGIRMVWRILNFRLFNASDILWDMKIEENSIRSTPELTNIYIRIPIADIYETENTHS